MYDANQDRYGFFTAVFSNGVEIETLKVGDGKAQFSDINYFESGVAIGMSYGRGQGVGTTENLDSEVSADLTIEWQVKFDSIAGVEAMERALTDVKKHLINRNNNQQTEIIR